MLKVFLALCFLAGCAHVPQVLDCAREEAAGLIPIVTAGLRGEDYNAALGSLASRVGDCLVKVAVQDVAGLKAEADPLVLKHAAAWLAVHP